MTPLSLSCVNCRAPFNTVPASPLERDCLLAVGACCPACNGKASRYFESKKFRQFEESEADAAIEAN